MSAPTNPARDLTGRNIRCWFVVTYGGQRGGIHFWRCMCRACLAEKVVAEPNILDRNVNTLSGIYRRCRDALQDPSGWIYGEWTVLGPAAENAPKPPGEQGPLWRCRCTCGTERDIAAQALITLPLLSCGCRPDADVRAELQTKWSQAKRGFNEALGDISRRGRERLLEHKWTQDMQRALCRFQPACVLCRATQDLTNHHVRPLSGGHGLEPGNAVRLCRACNSFICDRDLGRLSPGQARKLEIAAAQFKEYWESGCATPAAVTACTPVETPKAPDPALIELLRGLERGDDAAIPALANWLEERSYPRASAIREVARWEPVVTQRRTEANEVIRVEFRLQGQPCGPSVTLLKMAGDTEGSLAQRVEEARKRELSNTVWGLLEQLGLSYSQRDTLKQYLGITPSGVPATIEEIAQRQGKKVQTIRNRIDLALHRLAVSISGGCRQA